MHRLSQRIVSIIWSVKSEDTNTGGRMPDLMALTLSKINVQVTWVSAKYGVSGGFKMALRVQEKAEDYKKI